MALAQEITDEIDHWVSKYPPEQKRSAVIAALRIVQEHHAGWLRKDDLQEIADYLGLPGIMVYEVATFYDMVELSTVGEHKINVCTNLSCELSGCNKIIAHLKKRLGIGLGETTKDGKITLKEVECMAACANAPMFQVDDKKYHLDLTPEKIDALLQTLGVEVTND
jgi:NADH-quinone oxidoreductase subunit E